MCILRVPVGNGDACTQAGGSRETDSVMDEFGGRSRMAGPTMVTTFVCPALQLQSCRTTPAACIPLRGRAHRNSSESMSRHAASCTPLPMCGGGSRGACLTIVVHPPYITHGRGAKDGRVQGKGAHATMAGLKKLCLYAPELPPLSRRAADDDSGIASPSLLFPSPLSTPTHPPSVSPLLPCRSEAIPAPPHAACRCTNGPFACIGCTYG